MGRSYKGKQNSKLAKYKYSARLRKIHFELTKEEFVAIITADCAYCGAAPNENFNGVDRVNNTLGYILSNCVAACKDCNTAKASMELKEFVMLAKRIYEKHKAKKKD